MNKIAKRLRKVCLVIMVGVMLVNIVGCKNSTVAEAKEGGDVVVLKNQQEEINNIMKLGEITKIENFVASFWLNENELVGITLEDDIEYLAIYNKINDKVEKIEGETNPTKRNIIVSDDGDYILCERLMKWKEEKTGHSAYLIDKKDFSYTEISNKINSMAFDGDEVIYTEGIKLYKYNIKNKKREELKLREDLAKEISYNDTFEEYVARHNIRFTDDEDRTKSILEWMRLEYDRKIRNKPIVNLFGYKGEEIFFGSEQEVSYVYNIKDKTYRYADNTDRSVFCYEECYDYEKIRVERSGENFDMMVMWQTDKNGKKLDIIDRKLEGSFTDVSLSPMKNRLAYSVVRQDKTGYRVCVYDFDTHKKVELTGDYNSTYKIKWYKDESKFFYTHDDNVKEIPRKECNTTIVKID